MSAPASSLSRAPTLPAALGRSWLTAERLVIAGLVVLFLAVVAVTWQKWGVPEVDAGAELSTADLVAHGSLPYADVRYFYGPVGLYSLAGAFALFGTSFTTAFGFGLLQAAAILATFYWLCRRWLAPVNAGLATALLLAIGFSGTPYNFVLPHTNSATFGLLVLLLELVALTRGRTALAGALVGLAALTRPEFALVAVLAAAAYAFGLWRDADRPTALRAAGRMALPALAVAGGVLGLFAVLAGPHTLFFENLWPVDFIRSAGFKTQSYWMPFTPASALGLLARGAIYCGVVIGLVVSVSRLRTARGSNLIVSVWPLAAALAGVGLGLAAWHVSGVAAAEQSQVQTELTKGLLGMSWLPLLGLGVAAYAGVLLVRGRPAPLSGSWAIDLPLIVAAAVLGLRAYAAFTAERSYAPYYAAPLVLLLLIAHQRLAGEFPSARAVALAVPAIVALALGAYALGGLYADHTTLVNTERGSYLADAQAAPAVQGAVDEIRRRTPDGASILAGPADGGLYFMSDRRPALYEAMLLPGLLDSAADERAAIARLGRDDVSLAVLGARDLSDYGSRTFGTDYNALLGRYLQANTVDRVVVGRLDDPVAGSGPSRGYQLLELRAGG